MAGPSSSTNSPVNFNLIFLAADIELKRIAHPLPEVFNHLDNDSSPDPLQNRVALLNHLKQQGLGNDKSEICYTIERLYAIAGSLQPSAPRQVDDKPSPNRAEISTPPLPPTSDLSATESHNDALTDPLTHLTILENGRLELLKLAETLQDPKEKADATELATRLLKRKIVFTNHRIEELKKIESPQIAVLTFQFSLQDDLNLLYEILINEDKERARIIYKNLELNWELNQFRPTPHRDFDEIAPDTNAQFKKLMTIEQRLALKINFIEECNWRNAALFPGTNGDLIELINYYQESYYLLCRIANLQDLLICEQANVLNEDSDDEDLVHIQSDEELGAPNTNNLAIEARKNNEESIFHALNKIHEITGKMRAARLSNAEPLSASQQLINLLQPRHISSKQKEELAYIEYAAEDNLLKRYLVGAPKATTPHDYQTRILPVEERRIFLMEQMIDWVRVQLNNAVDAQQNISAAASIHDFPKTDPKLSEQLLRISVELEDVRLNVHANKLHHNLSVNGKDVNSHSPWKDETWGKILLHSTKKFAQQNPQNTLTEDFKQSIDAKERRLKDQEALYLTASQLEGPSSSVPTSSSSPSPSINLRQVQNEIYAAKISYHGAFLQRIIDKLGEYVQEEASLREKLAALQQTMPEDAEPATSEPLQKLITQQTKINDRLRHLNSYKDTLQNAFQTQLEAYQRIPQPRKEFLELLKEQVRNEAFNYLTMGFYSSEAYVTADEFITRKRYAEAGYCLAKAMAEWTQWQGTNPASILYNLVQDFLRWADDYPRDAARLASDILLTISIFHGQGLIDTLSQQVNAKIFVSSVLGTMGRDMADKPITPEHFKFRALADLVRYGPKASAGANALRNVGAQLMQGNFLAAMWDGITTYANDGYKASVIQRTVDALTDNTAQIARVALALMRGDSMQQIITSQAMIELVTVVGNIRRAYLSPGAIMREAMRKLATPFNEIRHAVGGVAERSTRLSSLTITVVIPTVMVAASVAGIFMATIAAVVSAVFLLNFYVRKVHPLVNRFWSETPRILTERAILDKHRDEVNTLADQHLADLRRLGVIQEVVPVTGYSNDAAESLIHRLVQEYMTLLNAGTPANLHEIVRLYVQTTNSRALEAAVWRSQEGRMIPESERVAFIKEVCEKVHDELIGEWLRVKIQREMEREFILRFTSYADNPNAERAAREVIENQRGVKERALQQLTELARRPQPGIELGPDETDNLRHRLEGIVERRASI